MCRQDNFGYRKGNERARKNAAKFKPFNKRDVKELVDGMSSYFRIHSARLTTQFYQQMSRTNEGRPESAVERCSTDQFDITIIVAPQRK